MNVVEKGRRVKGTAIQQPKSNDSRTCISALSEPDWSGPCQRGVQNEIHHRPWLWLTFSLPVETYRPIETPMLWNCRTNSPWSCRQTQLGRHDATVNGWLVGRHKPRQRGIQLYSSIQSQHSPLLARRVSPIQQTGISWVEYLLTCDVLGRVEFNERFQSQNTN